ncbi:hypothetical protein BDN72DRAFT_865258 [Pluteus cervinus]|uniref:Uncharacterized protein n=1 Tax=Pluteus cervinus TaxID=181527 RepID=A0ACD3A0W6_9AGAR|nr:hypothetical protein BDN72DRAFT_865258 [Pluteus cervinus]
MVPAAHNILLVRLVAGPPPDDDEDLWDDLPLDADLTMYANFLQPRLLGQGANLQRVCDLWISSMTMFETGSLQPTQPEMESMVWDLGSAWNLTRSDNSKSCVGCCKISSTSPLIFQMHSVDGLHTNQQGSLVILKHKHPAICEMDQNCSADIYILYLHVQKEVVDAPVQSRSISAREESPQSAYNEAALRVAEVGLDDLKEIKVFANCFFFQLATMPNPNYMDMKPEFAWKMQEICGLIQVHV